MNRTRKGATRIELRNPNNTLIAGSGNFTLAGSWDPEATREPGRARLYDLVCTLVRIRRRDPSLRPRDFVEIIENEDVARMAFPNLRWVSIWDPATRWLVPTDAHPQAWANCDNWLAAIATTGAERTIKTGARRLVPNPVGLTPATSDVVTALIKAGDNKAAVAQMIAEMTAEFGWADARA